MEKKSSMISKLMCVMNFMTRYGFFVIIITALLGITVKMTQFYNAIDMRISVMEEFMLENLEKQTEFLLGVKMEIAETSGNQLLRNYQRIQRIHTVYSMLLSEMQKRTIDSLYSELVLADMEQEARTLFNQGRHAQASIQYAAIAEAQPENREARFYYLYSLFLANRLDRSNYRLIKDGLQTLERNGYHRREIRYVLDFIDTEESGLLTETSR
jgi:hypothetical protein